jgi:hypothetical protein
MPRTKQTKGVCAFCGAEIGKGTVTRHLETCEKWLAAGALSKKQPQSEALYHLRVQPIGLNEFWLDLEARESSTLKDLDRYLRAIWLECCGHMSRFSIGGWGGHEIAMSRKVGDVFRKGVELVHIYDFGTSSETAVKCVGTRNGKATSKHPLALLARNVMPDTQCIECGERAEFLCMECLIENEIWGVLCDKHAQAHPHEEYGEPIGLVNSPRMGLCGYEGPAEPPY